MASKIFTKVKFLHHFRINNYENFLTRVPFHVSKPCEVSKYFSVHNFTKQCEKAIRNNFKISLGFTGLASGIGLYFLYKCKQNLIPELLPFVKAESIIPPKNSLRNRFNFIADIVDKSADAVVCIEVAGLSRWDRNLSQPSGSGFIVQEDGLILTNAHVVPIRQKGIITIKLRDGRTYQGHVEDYDLTADLATVRIHAKNLPTMTLGSSSDLRTGEWVVAIGNPLSLTDSVTAGVVSSARRQGKELGITHHDMEYIQTDAAITFGNSGGPLVNLDGEAVGINAMKVTAGISFAIPMDYAKEFLRKCEENKRDHKISVRNKRGYIGVSMLTLTPELLNELNRTNRKIPASLSSGVLIWKVMVGSPAYMSGLEPGDVVVEINGSTVEGVRNIYQALEQNNALRLKVLRNGSSLELLVTPEFMQ